MNILTVGNMYPPHSIGGYEVIWRNWVEYARAQGHSVRVLTTDFRLDGPAEPEHDEPDVRRDLRWYWRDHEFPRYGLVKRWRIESHNRRVLESHLCSWSPDAVVWWGMGGMSTALIERVRRATIPAVAVIGEFWLEYAPRVDAWMRIFADRPRFGRFVERVTGAITRVDFGRSLTPVFVSADLRRRAAEIWPELRTGRIAHHGPDRTLFRPIPRRDWDWSLLYLGRIDERKGVMLAVESLPELPAEAHLTVVGSGDPQFVEALRTRARDLGVEDSVRFAGPVDRDDLPATFARADALVFPALWAEPWGLVPSEAMAVGLPVVATGRGGSGEYLADHVNCLHFDPDLGAADLARKLRELASDPALRERLVEGGFRTVSELTAVDFNAEVLGVVDGLVRERREGTHVGFPW